MNLTNRVDLDLLEEVGTGPEHVYVYTFPSYMRSKDSHGNFMIKIGMTRKKTAPERVYEQISPSSPERGVLLLVINAWHASAVEDHIHQRLKALKKHVTDSPGNEWFISTPEEALALAREKEPEIVEAKPPEEISEWHEFYSSAKSWTTRKLAWIGFFTCCYWGYNAFLYFKSL